MLGTTDAIRLDKDLGFFKCLCKSKEFIIGNFSARYIHDLMDNCNKYFYIMRKDYRYFGFTDTSVGIPETTVTEDEHSKLWSEYSLLPKYYFSMISSINKTKEK